ncbi:50S ribosomal protein L11 methyltransferase [Saccharopolyspora taberi]|uniref:Protein arginine N-methyltransferase domain-containing protein n=1 Tax=Saccharopolyspora taberi TaxID=60895 RepID=A0ABN3VHW0_9PSEU
MAVPHVGDGLAPASLAGIPTWHFPMLNDGERNACYERAIRAAVRPGDLVLDIGAGSGLLAMIAASCGARQVVSCEVVPQIADVAREIVRANGCDDVVTIVNKRSTDLVVGEDLPARADVVVTETVDFGLLGEGILPAMRHARTCLAGPDASIIPFGATLIGAPVESAALCGLNHVTTACGYDVSLFNEFAQPGYIEARLAEHVHRLIAEPRPLASFDFGSDPLTADVRTTEFTAETSGRCDGVVFWFELALDTRTGLSNSPERHDSHWPQSFFRFAEPLAVELGTRVAVAASWSDHSIAFEPVAAPQRSTAGDAT